MSCMQGWRVDMEDAHSVVVSVPDKPEYSFFGVYDGHGGSYIANETASRILAKIMDQPSWKNVDSDVSHLEKAMIDGFKALDVELRNVSAR